MSETAALAPARYLVDANVVSELMRPAPSPAVLAWLDRAGTRALAIASPVIWEIRYGLATLAPGKRRDGLSERFDELRRALFADRIVCFGEDEATLCAEIMATRRSAGESLDDHLADAMIAACAVSRRLTVLTRNESEFRNTGAEVVNPWMA